jgi:hypothetical protein
MTYRVKNWELHYEKAQSRPCKKPSWVALPNKHDGKGFRRVAQHERSVEIFAAWVLIVQVASKMPERGLLVDEDGPLTAEDLAVKTGFPASIFHAAFTVLVDPKIGWLERVSGKEVVTEEQLTDSAL